MYTIQHTYLGRANLITALTLTKMNFVVDLETCLFIKFPVVLCLIKLEEHF